MARLPRIKIDGSIAGYHIVTRTRGRDFLLDLKMKTHFIKLLQKLKKLYFVEYGAFAILDNHYHLLLRFHEAEDISTDIAMKRWNTYHADTEFVRNPASEESRRYVTEELCNVSSFMKRLNYHLTSRYNFIHGTAGTLWERRFRSSIVERGWAFINCAAYIELNAFRASLVKKPEAYAFGSLHYICKKNAGNLLDTELLSEGLLLPDSRDQAELYSVYRAFVYEAGSSPHRDKPNGLVTTKSMLEFLDKYDLKPEKGSCESQSIEWIQAKVTAGITLTREIYANHVDPGLFGRRAHKHAAKWIQSMGESLWTVCSYQGRGSP